MKAKMIIVTLVFIALFCLMIFDATREKSAVSESAEFEMYKPQVKLPAEIRSDYYEITLKV